MGHVGVCRMKALARSFIWWPGLDKAIEEVAAQCEPCKVMWQCPKQYHVILGNFQMAHGKESVLIVESGTTIIFSCWLMLLANGLKSRQSLPQHPRQLLTSCEIFFQHTGFHRWWFPIMVPNLHRQLLKIFYQRITSFITSHRHTTRQHDNIPQHSTYYYRSCTSSPYPGPGTSNTSVNDLT